MQRSDVCQSAKKNQNDKNNIEDKNENAINFMTLNYSGILLSPFEFYSQEFSPIEQILSKTFIKCMQNNFQLDYTIFDWEMSRIDLKIQKHRYSPLYNENAGINQQTQKLMTKDQFEFQWNRWYEQYANEFNQLKVKKQQVESALTFDFMIYQTIIMYAYKVDSLANVEMFDTKHYKQLMKMFFSKPYVNQDLKIQKFLKGLENLNCDVIFLQQTTKELILALKKLSEYQIFQSRAQKKQSLIIIRKKKFQTFQSIDEFVSVQNIELQKLLQWNSDMAIAVVDKLILISGHLSSKPAKNRPQVQKMNECLTKLIHLYPQHIIVVGCDVNSQYTAPPKPYRYYPNSKLDYTNVKRRTYMQAQFQKADKIVQSCVDFLISSVNMKKTVVCDLNGQQKNRMNITYIPSQTHPFDHLIVYGTIQNMDALSKKKKV